MPELEHDQMGSIYTNRVEYIREGSVLDNFLIELQNSYQKKQDKYEKKGDQKNFDKFKNLNENLKEFRKETVISEEEFEMKKSEAQ